MDHLVHTFIDTVTLFLSQNDQLNFNQSGFSRGRSTETDLLSVTVALQIEKADSKSSVLILLDLSATFDSVNHQILLSTITRSELHWFESYLTGRSFRVAWGGEVSKEHQLATGFPLGSVLHHIHYITGTHYTSTWFLLPNSTIDDRQLYHLFQPDNPKVAAWISGCLANISAWMKEQHLQFNLAKTELLFFPATPNLQHDFIILLGSSKLFFGDQLTFKDHIVKTSRSCMFALHNIRRIRPFQTEHAAQLLAQALVISRLDYYNALLAGLPSCTIKPRQMIQNAAARLVFNDWSSNEEGPLQTSLYLPALATGCSLHQVQDIDVCVQNSHRLSTLLPPHSYESTSPPEA